MEILNHLYIPTFHELVMCLINIGLLHAAYRAGIKATREHTLKDGSIDFQPADLMVYGAACIVLTLLAIGCSVYITNSIHR